MQTYPLSQLTEETLNALVTLHEEESDLESVGRNAGSFDFRRADAA